jgi:hypothetical protein
MASLKDWASNIEYTNSVGDDKVRALVYGRAGVGKTVFSSTFPSPFIIDADKGLRSVREKEIPHVAVNRGERVFAVTMDILRSLRKGEGPFGGIEVKTLVIDSITAFADMLLYESMRFPVGNRPVKDPNNEKAEFDHWGELLNRLQHIVKYCRDMGLHVVATAGERLEKDDVRGSFVGHPDIPGQYRNKIAHEFDEVLYFETKISGKDVKYLCHTTPYLYYEGKSRTGLPPVIENPAFEKMYQ